MRVGEGGAFMIQLLLYCTCGTRKLILCFRSIAGAIKKSHQKCKTIANKSAAREFLCAKQVPAKYLNKNCRGLPQQQQQEEDFSNAALLAVKQQQNADVSQNVPVLRTELSLYIPLSVSHVDSTNIIVIHTAATIS